MLTRRTPVLAAVVTLVTASVLSGCGGDSGNTVKDTRPTRAATGKPCTYTADGRTPARKADLPPGHAAVFGSEKVVLKTSAGEIDATLDADRKPCTVNSFVSLADQGYFDGTTCHRLTTQGIYVLQCGDPSATGSGGPGYSFPDELSGKETYGPGTIAMANAGPDTNGSQFFLVYGSSPLDPNYTVFGTIGKAGLQVVKDIAAKGTSTGQPDGPPKTPVELHSVTAE